MDGELLLKETQENALAVSSSNVARITSYENSLDAYLSKISQVPLLSREDEVEYARRYRDHKDLQAAQYLVLSNLRFVVYVAKGFKGYGLPMAVEARCEPDIEDCTAENRARGLPGLPSAVTVSACPSRDAMWSGTLFVLVARLTSAPALRSNLIIAS